MTNPMKQPWKKKTIQMTFEATYCYLLLMNGLFCVFYCVPSCSVLIDPLTWMHCWTPFRSPINSFLVAVLPLHDGRWTRIIHCWQWHGTVASCFSKPLAPVTGQTSSVSPLTSFLCMFLTPWNSFFKASVEGINKPNHVSLGNEKY